MKPIELFGVIVPVLATISACNFMTTNSSESKENAIVKTQTLEQKLVIAGLFKVGGGIEVDLAYTKEDPSGKINFLNKNMYGDLRSCYLRPEVAKKLAAAQRALKEKVGEKATLVLYDCARPLSVQKTMWKRFPIPNPDWVADPAIGSKHNFGASVDLSFRDANGKIADMGSRFDEFSDISVYAASGFEISDAAHNNRKILRDAMVAGGFLPYEGEWWHFDGHPFSPHRIFYSRLLIPLIQLNLICLASKSNCKITSTRLWCRSVLLTLSQNLLPNRSIYGKRTWRRCGGHPKMQRLQPLRGGLPHQNPSSRKRH